MHTQYRHWLPIRSFPHKEILGNATEEERRCQGGKISRNGPDKITQKKKILLINDSFFLDQSKPDLPKRNSEYSDRFHTT